jgi:photosystem II stability/assembly factor-like uncharacterized protein
MNGEYMNNLIFLQICIIALISSTTGAFAQWEQTNGPAGGTVNCFAVKGDSIFAGTDGAGLFLSIDNGETWKNILYNDTLSQFISLTIKDEKIFAIMKKQGPTYSNLYLLSYKDTIIKAEPILSGCLVNAIDTNSVYVFAATSKGMFRSSDNGASWAWICNGLTDKDALSIGIKGTNICTGTQEGRIFLSTDNGDNWKLVAQSDSYSQLKNFASTKNNLFAGFYNNDDLFRSADSGKTWININQSLPKRFIVSIEATENEVYVSNRSGQIYHSTDEGNTWADISVGTGNIVNDIALKDGNLFAGIINDGIYLSTDNGISWNEKNRGYINSRVIALTNIDTILFAGTYGQGVFRSSNNGENWKHINNGLTDFNIRSLRAIDTLLFAGTDDKGIFRSSDKGENWEQVNNGFPYKETNYFAESFASNGQYIFIGALMGGVYRSSDYGESWKPVNIGKEQVYVVKILSGNLYAATYSKILRSSSNGESWIEVFNDNTGVHSFVEYPPNLFAGSYRGLLKSTNNGYSWSYVLNGLKNVSCHDLALCGTNFLAGSVDKGVFISNKVGSDWIEFNEGVEILSFNVKSKESLLFPFESNTSESGRVWLII